MRMALAMLRRKQPWHPSQGGSAGFTLIELILVMTLLTIAVGLTAPSLANFFRGRTLDSEARRLMAMARQAQSRAVSEGLPVELWLDTQKGAIGMEAETSYEETDAKAVEFTLDPDIRLEIPLAAQTTRTQPNQTALKPSSHPNLPRIRFLPDGFFTESSPNEVRLVGRDGGMIALVQSRNRLRYELQPVRN